jgi:hypothetical protein
VGRKGIDILPYEIPLSQEIVVTNVDGELYILAGDYNLPVPWGESIALSLTAEQPYPDNVVPLFK